MEELDNLVGAGVLKLEPPSEEEIEGLVRIGEGKLTDSANTDLQRESRFDLAYGAAHSFALAALRLRGYRPNNKRYAVFQALPLTLAVSPSTARFLIKCHGMRNDAEYEGTLDLDARTLSTLISAATEVRDALNTYRAKA